MSATKKSVGMKKIRRMIRAIHSMQQLAGRVFVLFVYLYLMCTIMYIFLSGETVPFLGDAEPSFCVKPAGYEYVKARSWHIHVRYLQRFVASADCPPARFYASLCTHSGTKYSSCLA